MPYAAWFRMMNLVFGKITIIYLYYTINALPRCTVCVHCLINVQNNDEKCFVWSVLSALYPATDYPYRLSKYIDYEHFLNDLTTE